jgi:dipeptidase D
MYVDGDWVRARNYLRADNGLGVAAIMAVLESKDIAHPIEALFTIDEETGTGSFEFKRWYSSRTNFEFRYGRR